MNPNLKLSERYVVAGTTVLFEIDGLGGRDVIGDPELHTVFHNAHEAQ